VATEHDWESYRTAVVDMAPPGHAPFRIVPAGPGVTGTWPDGLLAPVVVITAWDPDSVRLARDLNQARQGALEAELDARGTTRFPATGRDLGDDHHEDGFAVSGLTEEEARDLGRRHGQAAIYVWTPEEWQVVSCTADRRHVTGWRVEPVPSTTG